MSLIMTIQTIFIRLFIYLFSKNIWMSLTLTLVIVGGLMISFVYVCSLIPSEPYSRNITWIIPLLVIPIIILIFENFFYYAGDYNFEFSPLVLYNRNTYITTILIISILVLTLLVVCINTLQVKCPMRLY